MLRSQALETLLNLLNLTQPCTKDSQSLLQDFLNPLNLTWLCTKASWNLLRNLLRNPVERDLALRQSLPALLRNLLQNHVEPDLALHQSLPGLLRNLLRNPVERDLALHQSLPNLLRSLRYPVEPDQTFAGTFFGNLFNLTWLCTKVSRHLRRNLLGSPVEHDLARFAPKPPRPSPEPSSEPCWTWPGSAPKPPGTFSGTFSKTMLNLTWLCTKASWLRTRRFSDPTFRPSRATNHGKNTVFRDFPTFSRICIFFLLTLSLLLFFLLIFLFSLPLPCSAFHLSILSEVWLPNFLRISHNIPMFDGKAPITLKHHPFSSMNGPAIRCPLSLYRFDGGNPSHVWLPRIISPFPNIRCMILGFIPNIPTYSHRFPVLLCSFWLSHHLAARPPAAATWHQVAAARGRRSSAAWCRPPWCPCGAWLRWGAEHRNSPAWEGGGHMSIYHSTCVCIYIYVQLYIFRCICCYAYV